MSVDTFVPEIWAAELLAPLERAHVYAAPEVVNRNYEGEITQAGDTVHINSLGDPTIGDYVPNSTVISEERLHTSDQVLTITQSKYFAFYVDDVDRRQAMPGLMPEAMRRTSYGFRNLVDLYIASFYTGVLAANSIGTTAITTPALALSGLSQLMVKLDEADVPRDGRFAIVQPWYHGLLTDTSEFIAATPEEALLNGRAGRAKGFDIRMSNNSPNPTGDDWVVIAGTNQGISYAEQIPIGTVEAYRSQTKFADVVRGLHLYGAKLVSPEHIATLIASKT